jgi:hypothetical protein
MFVYSAAFLAPVLFFVFDIAEKLRDGDLKFEDLGRHMRGVQWISLAAFIILILTLLAYTSSRSNPDTFSETYLGLLLTGQGFVVYLASLLTWYTVILWNTTPNSSYVHNEKKEAQDFSANYAKRRGQ